MSEYQEASSLSTVFVVQSETGSQALERFSVLLEKDSQSALRKSHVTLFLTCVKVRNVIKEWSLITESFDTFHSVMLAAVRADAKVRSTIVPVVARWPMYVCANIQQL